MEYLAWFDDNAKRSTAEKIQAARDAWHARYGTLATKAYVNEVDRAVEVPGVEIIVQPFMRINNYGVLG
jgi:hypothetical protein